jgi:hypothetical protein
MTSKEDPHRLDHHGGDPSALLRLAELESMAQLALSAKANLYIGLDAPRNGKAATTS